MKPTRMVATVTAAASLLLAGCGSSGGGRTIAVEATDTACMPAKTDLQAGKVTFAVHNTGTKVTELYVYAMGDSVKGEVENVGPGTTRNLTVTLGAGHYQLACKPGQSGTGIRADIVVTGSVGHSAAGMEHADRTVEVEARDYSFGGVESFTARAGERIKFELKNVGTTEHEMEVKAPDGTVVGEVPPVRAGREGKAVIKLSKAGTYTFVCGIEDHAARGMTATFQVTEQT